MSVNSRDKTVQIFMCNIVPFLPAGLFLCVRKYPEKRREEYRFRAMQVRSKHIIYSVVLRLSHEK